MSTRVGEVEVGHGQNAVVVQMLGGRTATVLTPSQAERLAVYLMRQATAARWANREATEARADASLAPALAALHREAGDSIAARQETS